MSTNLDKSLDDIIGENPRRGGGRRGGNRQSSNRDSPNRSSPYTRREGGGGGVQKRGGGGGGASKQQQAIMFNPAAFMAAAQQQQQQQGASSGRIHISNLDYAVSEADIRALFGQVGQVNRATLNYGPNGKSKGTGEVQFRNPAHAALAVEKYHGVTLDGRPMRIEIAFNPMAAASLMMPAMMPAPMVQASGNVAANTRSRRGAGGNSNAGNNNNNNRSGAAAAASSGGSAGGRRGGGRGGRGRRNESDSNRSPTTKEALDADLDSYMQDAEKPATA
ncbi:hypothetical protein GGF42_000317 [Coemansia sp. RSA 2424]|nr:hypothetical protein GGF42_000317 [Coemansia sp. RSA 2424]